MTCDNFDITSQLLYFTFKMTMQKINSRLYKYYCLVYSHFSHSFILVVIQAKALKITYFCSAANRKHKKQQETMVQHIKIFVSGELKSSEQSEYCIVQTDIKTPPMLMLIAAQRVLVNYYLLICDQYQLIKNE